MTSAWPPDPKATSNKYNDVHRYGSAFGQDLNSEAKVRDLLLSGPKSKFGALIGKVANDIAAAVGEVVTVLVRAFGGEGATVTALEGAVTTRLGSIDTAISESGKQMTELSNKVDSKIVSQEEINNQLTTVNEQVSSAVDTANRTLDLFIKTPSVASSAISMLAGTTNPSWTKGAKIDNSIARPPGVTTDSWTAAGTITIDPEEATWVTVDPTIDYDVELWWYTDTPGIRTVIEMVPQKTISSSMQSVAKPDSGIANAIKSSVWTTPANTTAGWHHYKGTIKFAPSVSAVRIHRVQWMVPGMNGAGKTLLNGLTITPHIPPQADLDKAQNDAIAGLNKANELSLQFQEEQVKVNRLVQQQLWMHQDMIELVDIRSQKTWGFFVDYSNATNKPCPYYTGTTTETKRVWNPDKKVYEDVQVTTNNSDIPIMYWETPYFELWRDKLDIFLACRGAWVGEVRVTVNWDKGQADDWVIKLEEGGQRAFLIRGGAIHIFHRHISVEVGPRSLMRKVQLWSKGNGWEGVQDPNGLVRTKITSPGMERIRLKNAVTANRGVYVRDEADNKLLVPAGSVIYAQEILASDNVDTSSILVFNEVDDPTTSYTVDQTRPNQAAELLHA